MGRKDAAEFIVATLTKWGAQAPLPGKSSFVSAVVREISAAATTRASSGQWEAASEKVEMLLHEFSSALAGGSAEVHAANKMSSRETTQVVLATQTRASVSAGKSFKKQNVRHSRPDSQHSLDMSNDWPQRTTPGG